MPFFTEDKRNALDSIEYAQYIAFAPFVFQASRTLKNTGILSLIEDSGKEGMTMPEIIAQTSISAYGVRVLLEAGLGIGLIIEQEKRYRTTKTGSFILHDAMTKVNMDFVHDVCYQGMFDFDKSIINGKPEGLKTLGNWNTVYEGLSKLPTEAKESWFAFDHFYSDGSFGEALPHIFKRQPRKILDIGGNTGKWTLQCLQYNNEVEMGIVDLPGQLNMAKANIGQHQLEHRVTLHECNLLEQNAELPVGYDIIWMSQFLDCFSDDEILSILKRCHRALGPEGKIAILEPFWDCQQFKAAAFCLQMTSLYFTNIANGNSQMYHSGVFIRLIEEAGFKVEEQIDQLGISNTLLICSKR